MNFRTVMLARQTRRNLRISTLPSGILSSLFLSCVLCLPTLPLCGQPSQTIVFNVTEILGGQDQTPAAGEQWSITPTKNGGSVKVVLVDSVPTAPSFGGTATVTVAAPSGVFTGKEVADFLSRGPAFVLDNPATFQVTASLSNSDDFLDVLMSGLDKTTEVSCTATLNAKKPTATCQFQAFQIQTSEARGEPPGGPRLLKQEFHLYYSVHGGTGPSALYYAEYDYQSCGGGSNAPATQGTRPDTTTIPSCGDKISLGPVFPSPGTTIILAGPKTQPSDPTTTVRTPEFVGTVNYDLETRPQGVVALELRGPDTANGTPGPLIQTTAGTNIGQGTGKLGYSEPYLVFPPFDIGNNTSPGAPGTNIDPTVTKELLLRAILADRNTGNTLLTSAPVHYPLAAAKVTVQLLDVSESSPSNTTITVVDPTQVALNANGISTLLSTGDSVKFRISYQLPDGVMAKLSMRRQTIAHGASHFSTGTLRPPSQGEAIVVGTKTDDFEFTGDTDIPEESDTAIFQVAMTIKNSGQVVLSNSLVIPVNEVTLVSVSPSPDTALPISAPALLISSPTAFTVQLKAIARDSGLRVVRHVRAIHGAGEKDTVIPPEIVSGTLTPGQPTDVPDSFSVIVPSDIQKLVYHYSLAYTVQNLSLTDARTRYVAYQNFLSTIPSLAVNSFDFVAGHASNIKSTISKGVDNFTFAANLLQDKTWGPLACLGSSLIKLSSPVKAILKYLCASRPVNASAGYDGALANFAPSATGTADTSNLITLYTWTFDPPVPNDGSFAGDFTFDYSVALLPDDPNFDESKLQIVAIDNTTGNATAIPAAIDQVNKTATVHLTQIGPLYVLAVPGPFSNSSLTLQDAAASSTFSLVNLGAAAAPVALRAFAGTGDPAGATTPNISVPSSQQFLQTSANALPSDATNAGWVRADAAGTQVVGAEILTDGNYFDALPAVSHPTIGPWIVTAAEQAEGATTQLRLTNPGTQMANINIFLQNADGSDQGLYSGQLAPKQQSAELLTAYFPSLPASFQGYAIIWGDQPITVAEYLDSASTRAAMNAQIPSQATKLYAPRLGAANGVTMLTLVNPTGGKMSVTVRGFGPNGAAVGTPATFSLAAGQQYRNSLSAALGIADTQTGTLVVTSDQPALVGHLDLLDRIQHTFRALLPLDASPALSSTIAYAGQSANTGTSLSISNTGSSPANVTLKAFATGGAAMGTRSVTLAPNAALADTLANVIPAAAALATGFVTIASDQPVTAAALLSANSELGFLPAQPVSLAASGGNNGPPPQISGGGVVNAASFAPKLVRGGLASIFGSNFVSGSQTGQASSLPLPLSLAGVSVSVGGVSAPLIYVSANQINFQVPFEVPAGLSAAIVVTANGVASPSVFAPMSDYGVGVFTYARTASTLDPIIVHNSTNQLITPSSPATPNEFLVVYATGVGKLTTAPRTGAASPSSPLANAVDTPTVTVGGVAAKVLFAGLTPGFVGLVQLNIQLPASLPSGTLPLVISFPGDASPSVNLSVQGNIPNLPKLTLSTTSLAFGSVTVNQTKDLSLLVSNTGSAPLNATLKPPGTGFNLLGALSLTVAAGQSTTVTVRFAPASAGAFNSSLTITSNDPGSPATITLTGTGQAVASNDVVLQVDGGQFDTVVGYPSGTATAYFVNRLTPPSYPATLKSVQIFFSTRPDGLALNAPLTVISATNPSGSAAISIASAGSIDLTPGKVGTLDQFTTYTVPARTITSGDFVVGFMVQNPAGIFPGELDQATPSQMRSYTSSNGLTFTVLDSISPDIAGNLGIRAVVALGSSANEPSTVVLK
ncbi:MAG TPA: choice-of-anchor D domain-containing protein [Bryobacteraceae bacterium]|nr:choice-of-anchor D domain-containing protein [Bryobacteraceae bacterium]